jgi:tetratricopeptide (TPR) repeat protein
MATDGERRKCFVISPIGEKDTEIRKLADDVLDLLIPRALDRYGFDVQRGDKLPTPGAITTEVVKLLQEAELCIVDLTGQNPNVFYECGRRHETGRPIIQIAQRGTVIPFDLAERRTVFYDDLSDSRQLEAAAEEIRALVDTYEQQGYTVQSSGESLSTVIEAINRIERKIDRIERAPVPAVGAALAGGGVEGYDLGSIYRQLSKTPITRFMEAIASGNFDEADSVLPQLRADPDIEDANLMSTAAMLAGAGKPNSHAFVRDVADELDPSTADISLVQATTAGLAAAVRASQDELAAERLETIATAFEQRPDVTNIDKAYVLNQLQMVFHILDRTAEAIAVQERVVQMAPAESAYFYNLSLLYEGAGRINEAMVAIDQCLAVADGTDPDHWSQAVDVYLAGGREEDARQALGHLQALDPGRVRMKAMLDEKVRHLL